MKIPNRWKQPGCWRKCLFPLKILISGLIFYLLFRKLDLTQLRAGFIRTGLEIVFFLLFTAIFKLGLLYVNWRKFLFIHTDYRASGSEVRRSFLIGESLRFLIPGGYGMIGKIFFVRSSRALATLSVALEKFFQIWTSLSFAVLAGYFYFTGLPVALRLTIIFIVVFLPLWLYLISGFARWEKVRSLRSNYLQLLPGVGLRLIIYMVVTIWQYYVLLNRLGEIDFWQAAITVPLILSANLIPVTFAGLGLRESFAAGLLPAFGFSMGTAVYVSLLIFFFNSLLPALAGLIMLIVKGSDQHYSRSSDSGNKP